MLVYRFEERVKSYNIGEPVTRYEGVFAGGIVGACTDANYEEYGCTMVDYKNRDYRFGCASIEQLIEYFGSDFQRLIEADEVVMVEYEVRDDYCVFSDEGIEMVFEVEAVMERNIIHGKELDCE